MNSIRILCMAVLVALDLSGTAVVRAQAAGGASPAGTDKIGVVDVRQAIVSTAEGKQASAELQSQFAGRKNELGALSKQIATLRDRLAGAQMLSEDERARLERQGQQVATQYDRKNTDLNEDLQVAQNDVVERIGRKLMDGAAVLFQDEAWRGGAKTGADCAWSETTIKA